MLDRVTDAEEVGIKWKWLQTSIKNTKLECRVKWRIMKDYFVVILCFCLTDVTDILKCLTYLRATYYVTGAIMVQCMRVNATFKRRRAASFFDVRSRNRRQLFSLHRRDVCAVSVLVSKHFFRYRYRIDTGGIGRYRVPDTGIGLTLTQSAKSCCIISCSLECK